MKAGEKTINLLACIAFVLAAGLGAFERTATDGRTDTEAADATDTADSFC